MIGTNTDAITYVSKYTQPVLRRHSGPRAALEYLPPGVDIDRFAPDPDAPPAHPTATRTGRPAHHLVPVTAGAAQRPGLAHPGAAAIARKYSDVALVIAGGGPYAEKLHELADANGTGKHVVFAGSVPVADLTAFHAMPDVFAMPCRTRSRGLDVEGLGIDRASKPRHPESRWSQAIPAARETVATASPDMS